MTIEHFERDDAGITYRLTVRTVANGRKSFTFQIKQKGGWQLMPPGPHAIRRLMSKLFAEEMTQTARRSTSGPKTDPDAPSFTFDVERAAGLLQAFGNAHRFAIVTLLREGEMDVGGIRDAIGIGQSATSQHLRILRIHKIVRTRRDAQTIFYRLAGPEAILLIDKLGGLARPTDADPIRRTG